MSADLVALLLERGLTLSTAESCTGGLLGAMITESPGASEVFLGGIISYTNEVKVKVLGVSRQALNEYGAVSEQVAIQMAEGVRRVTGSDIGVSVTGLAGPGTDGVNPVGTVYIGISANGSAKAKRFLFPGTRADIRKAAALRAIALIITAI